MKIFIKYFIFGILIFVGIYFTIIEGKNSVIHKQGYQIYNLQLQNEKQVNKIEALKLRSDIALRVINRNWYAVSAWDISTKPRKDYFGELDHSGEIINLETVNLGLVIFMLDQNMQEVSPKINTLITFSVPTELEKKLYPRCLSVGGLVICKQVVNK